MVFFSRMGEDVDELAILMDFANRAGEWHDVLRRSSLLGNDVLWAKNATEFYELIVALVFHLVVFFYEFQAISGRRSK